MPARTKVNKYVEDLQKGQDAVTALIAKSKKLKKAQEESDKESDEPATARPAQTKKGKTNTPTVPDGPSEKEKIAEELAELRKSYSGHLEDWKKAQEKRIESGNSIFGLNKNLFDETALLKWNKIVQKQFCVTPWTDLNGKSHDNKARQKTVKSFKDCAKFHMLQVFPDDAAECQKYYINNHLKKPAKVTIRHFANRVEQLNSYVTNLPGLIDSPKALPLTRKIKAYDEAELAQTLLQMCPTKWQDQYNLTQGIILQSLQNTIETLKTIK